MTAATKSDYELTKVTPYLALPGTLWVSILGIAEKINRVITVPPCMWFIKEESSSVICPPVINLFVFLTVLYPHVYRKHYAWEQGVWLI